MHHSEELVSSIDARLTAARREITALEAALAAIHTDSGTGNAAPAGQNGTGSAKNGTGSAKNGSAAPAARTARTTRGARGATRRGARTPRRTAADVVPAGKLEALLARSDGSTGLSAAELTEQAGGARDQVLTLLRELEASGRVRRSGQRRGTRWHAITDEDRIAARAAQLESQSRRSRAAAS